MNVNDKLSDDLIKYLFFFGGFEKILWIKVVVYESLVNAVLGSIFRPLPTTKSITSC